VYRFGLLNLQHSVSLHVAEAGLAINACLTLFLHLIIQVTKFEVNTFWKLYVRTIYIQCYVYLSIDTR
jgi:hypothetical protein